MNNRIIYRILIVALFWCQAGSINAAPPSEFLRLDDIPLRPKNATTGAEFAHRTAGMPQVQRQREAVQELLQGNIPDFLRNLTAVTLSSQTENGDMLTAIIWVTPDYLAIGSDTDFLRMPLTYPSAVAIANAFHCLLPTRKIVDAVNAQATVHLEPQPMTPGPQMRTNAYYLTHHNMIEAQFKKTGYSHGVLVSGNKKDVLLTNRLFSHPGRIAIYGWHRSNGEPIQPLSTVHGARYADYSHGLRLVYGMAWFNGDWYPVADMLQDPKLAPMLTDEEPLLKLALLME